MQVSIVILSYLRLDCTIKCITSLLENSSYNHQIIVIEQTNSDYVKRLRELFPSIEVKELEHNFGVAIASNCAIQYVINEYVLFLDNDCVADKDWDKNFWIFDKYKPDVLTTKLKVFSRGQEKIRECEFIDYTWGPEGCSISVEEEIHRCTYIRGVAFHRVEVFKKLDGFDENFFVGCQDADYGFRVRNYKLFYTPLICISHFKDRSCKEYSKVRKSTVNESITYFKSKWEAELTSGAMNILLDSTSPLKLVKERLESLEQDIKQGKNRYVFFKSEELIQKAKELHGL